MRSNSASAPWISTWTLSSWPSGKKRRDWRVVKATIVPIETVVSPSMISAPATRYTKAGMMLKNVPISAKNQRPIIWPRTWRSPRRCDSARKRSMLASCWPNVLLSRMPDTLSDSSVMALISAIERWVRVLTSRRTLPTR